MQNAWFPGVTFPFGPYGSSGQFPGGQPMQPAAPQPVYYQPAPQPWPQPPMRMVSVGHAETGLPWGEIIVTAALSAFAGVVFGRMFDRLL